MVVSVRMRTIYNKRHYALITVDFDRIAPHQVVERNVRGQLRLPWYVICNRSRLLHPVRLQPFVYALLYLFTYHALLPSNLLVTTTWDALGEVEPPFTLPTMILFMPAASLTSKRDKVFPART